MPEGPHHGLGLIGRRHRVDAFAVVALAASIVAACGGGGGSSPVTTPLPSVPAASAGSPHVPPGSASALPGAPSRAAPSLAPEGTVVPAAVLVGAGDIGQCDRLADVEATGRLVEAAAPPTAIVFTAGDNAYPDGSGSDFARCYDPGWGAFRDRTRPAAGNHDWNTAGAAGYRAYFGAAAGSSTATWYAYDAGTWRVIVLDSACAQAGGCGPSSPQGKWLAAELTANPAACSLAIWHRPLRSSAMHGDQADIETLFGTVARAGVDLVINGHDHDYERFAPLDALGRAAPGPGTREFVVGTGGASTYDFGTPDAGSEVRITGQVGVLVLELGSDGYAWRFVVAPGGAVLDSGRDVCH